MEVRLSIEPYMTIMLGSDRSRGYCLEMICADFLAGVNVENGSAEALLFSIQRLFNLLPHQQQQYFYRGVTIFQICATRVHREHEVP